MIRALLFISMLAVVAGCTRSAAPDPASALQQPRATFHAVFNTPVRVAYAKPVVENHSTDGWPYRFAGTCQSAHANDADLNVVRWRRTGSTAEGDIYLIDLVLDGDQGATISTSVVYRGEEIVVHNSPDLRVYMNDRKTVEQPPAVELKAASGE